MKFSILLFIALFLVCGTDSETGLNQGRDPDAQSSEIPSESAFEPDYQDLRFYKDLKYGPHELQTIDLWIPKSDKPTPLVIYIHGGGFRSGDKARINSERLCEYLSANMAYASVNYRLTPEVTFPDTHLDCVRAVQFLRHHAQKFNLDPVRFAGTGGSAGAGICMWLAFKDDMADLESTDPIARQSTRLTCIAVWNGQSSYDPFFIEEIGVPRFAEHRFFFPFYGISKEEMGSPKARKLYAEASPINFATSDDVPVLLNYSYENVTVTEETHIGVIVHHPKFGLVLKEKLDNLGIDCIVQYVGYSEGKWISEFDFISKYFGP